MRKLFLVCGSLSCLVLLLGCPKKKGDGGDAEADAEAGPVATAAPEDAAPPPPAAPAAKNAGEVARFAAEAKVEDAAKISVLTNARQSPRGGGVVAALKAGTDVTKLAEYQECFLVTFADPKDANTTLMGWVGKEGFNAVVIRDAGARDAAVQDSGAGPACAAGQVSVILASGMACKKKCAKDADCKGGAAGACAPANTGSKVVRVCAAD